MASFVFLKTPSDQCPVQCYISDYDYFVEIVKLTRGEYQQAKGVANIVMKESGSKIDGLKLGPFVFVKFSFNRAWALRT